MRTLFFFTFLAVFAFETNAQDIQKMELKPNGFVGNDSTKNYIVIEIPTKKQNELYKSALVYLSSIYRNPQNVITSVENESIIINGMTESIIGDLKWYKYRLYYNINIQFKDGKMKFEPTITDFIEIYSENKERKIYVANSDSPNEAEINCIWMTGESKLTFLLKEDLKLSTENWLNGYLSSLIEGMTNDDW